MGRGERSKSDAILDQHFWGEAEKPALQTDPVKPFSPADGLSVGDCHQTTAGGAVGSSVPSIKAGQNPPSSSDREGISGGAENLTTRYVAEHVVDQIRQSAASERAPPTSDPESYEAWNRALCNYFFSERSAGRPIYLDPEEVVLDEVCRAERWTLDDPKAALVEVVRQTLDLTRFTAIQLSTIKNFR